MADILHEEIFSSINFRVQSCPRVGRWGGGGGGGGQCPPLAKVCVWGGGGGGSCPPPYTTAIKGVATIEATEATASVKVSALA